MRDVGKVGYEFPRGTWELGPSHIGIRVNEYMKQLFEAVFRPLFIALEAGDGRYVYKPSHRLILKIMGSLFLLLACASLAAGIIAGVVGALVPCLVFAVLGMVCLVVAFMGSDKAVARIWSNR